MRKLTTEDFIEKAKQVHGDKYDYSKVNYINNRTKVCIICPEHGEFWQNPAHHIEGCGCRKCWDKSLCLQNSDFLNNAQKVHGDKYDYSKVKYVNCNTKVCIICPEHGEFWQLPNNHLRGQGCPKCGWGREKRKLSQNEFIDRLKKIHGDKYDYTKTIYAGANKKVIITCSKHGDINIYANSLLKGYNCIKCENERRAKRLDDFICESKEMHGDKYDYSKVNYINSYTKVCIICPEHGEFWQIPSVHLKLCGCPICKQSKLEKEIIEFLKVNNIKYEYQKRFEWLGKQSLDFYLPEYNIAIECQGEQHFYLVNYFGGEKKYIKQKENDTLKYILCKENNLNIIYYTNIKNIDNYFAELIYDKNKILEILSCKK